MYDIIFAGGGAAACVTAGRLAVGNPDLKILILEAGPHTRDVPQHVQPGRYFGNLLRAANSGVFTLHEGRPSPALLGRKPIVPTGRAVGGGSSVNFCAYTRAAASDYDDWEKRFGNKGWGSNDIIPLLKKAETYQGVAENDTHGSNGPIKVSLSHERTGIPQNFLEVAEAYDRERLLTDDPNSFFSCDEYGRWARYIDAKTGRRSDTAHGYIYNQEGLHNVTILERSRVVRVIFEQTTAVGIEYVDDLADRTLGVPPRTIVKASKLVVLSSGALGTPAILERSGIGSRKILEENQIAQLVDLPGVGENYMDHNFLCIPFRASTEAETLDATLRASDEELASIDEKWRKDGKGPLSQTGVDAGVKLRPTSKELQSMSPGFDQRWETYFKNASDKPVMLVWSFSAYLGPDPSVLRDGNCYSIGFSTAYPVSTGHVHIRGRLDPYEKLDFNTGFLDDPADLIVLRWAYKKCRELGRRMKYFRGEVASGHPAFSTASPATIATSGPVAITAADIVYTKEDDAAVDRFIREKVETSWHPVGTCAMKPRDIGGVVDGHLNVYGTQKLKVADCSITPSNVGANTYNTAIAIGEKAAVIIAEELGIHI